MNPQTPPEEEFTIKVLSILKSSKSCSRQPPQHHKKTSKVLKNLGGLTNETTAPQQPPRFPNTLEV